MTAHRHGDPSPRTGRAAMRYQRDTDQPVWVRPITKEPPINKGIRPGYRWNQVRRWRTKLMVSFSAGATSSTLPFRLAVGRIRGAGGQLCSRLSSADRHRLPASGLDYLARPADRAQISSLVKRASAARFVQALQLPPRQATWTSTRPQMRLPACREVLRLNASVIPRL